MKYNFFDELNTKYGIPGPNIYSKLFSGIKFISNTLEENDNILSIDTKIPNEEDRDLTIFFLTNKNMYNDLSIDKIYFLYNYNYYVISNIHIIEEGLVFDFECFDYDLYKLVSMEKNERYPTPLDFERFPLSGDYKDTGTILKDSKDDVISYVVRNHNNIRMQRARKE